MQGQSTDHRVGHVELVVCDTCGARPWPPFNTHPKLGDYRQSCNGPVVRARFVREPDSAVEIAAEVYAGKLERIALALNRIATAAVEGRTEDLVSALDEARDVLNAD